VNRRHRTAASSKAAAALLVVAVGCNTSSPPPPPPPPAPKASPPPAPATPAAIVVDAAVTTSAPAPAWRTHEIAGSAVDVRAAPGATEVIIGLHGYGSNADNLMALFDQYPGADEVDLVDGFESAGAHGRAWFAWPHDLPDDDLARAISGAETKLWPVILAAAAGRTIVVMGFSQGAVMAYALAAHHPEIRVAVPISGRLPVPLYPRAGARTAPVVALHGDADPRVDIALDRTTNAAFGASATLHEYAGVGHTITPEMRAALFAAIGR
jgi:predicted esterase